MLPLFLDQYDNSTRIVEKGYGIRLEAYSFTDKQMIEAIERLLGDGELGQRLQIASDRIKNSQSKANVCQQIETIVQRFNFGL